MKGRILKVKTGYNPNSSSIGADIIVFFSAGAAVTILFNAVAAIVSARTGCEGDPEGAGPLPARESREEGE